MLLRFGHMLAPLVRVVRRLRRPALALDVPSGQTAGLLITETGLVLIEE